MKKTKLLFIAVSIIALVGVSIPMFKVAADEACLGAPGGCKVDTTFTLEITAGNICIGSEATFDFGQKQIASSLSSVEASFAGTDYFYVDDLKGADLGYYTTLQSTNLVGPDSATILATNISVKASGITTIDGTSNARVVLDNGMSAYQALNNPVTFIKRENATNYGVIGKYGTLPTFKIDVPAYQSVGQYTGTLTYTLYENS